MDHLETPANPYYPIVVPYYGGELYDGKGFTSYPGRKGRKFIEFTPNRVEFLQKTGLPDSIRFLKELSRKLPLDKDEQHVLVLDGVISILYTVLTINSPSKEEWNSLQNDMISADEYTNDLTSPERMQEGVRLLKSLEQRHEKLLSEPTLFDAQSLLSGIYADGDEVCQEPVEAWMTFFQDLSFAMANDASWKASKRTKQNLHKKNFQRYEPDSELRIESPRPLADNIEDLRKTLQILAVEAISILKSTYADLFSDGRPGQDTVSARDDLAFLQTWLFFGTLVECSLVFDTEVDISIYVTGGSNPVITTTNLMSNLKKWRSANVIDDESVQQVRAGKVKYILTDCKTFVDGLQDPQRKDVSDLLLSVQLLCTTIHHYDFGKSSGIVRTLAFRSPYLSLELGKLGVCPHQIAFLEAQYDIAVQYYTYLLGPPLKQGDHSACSKDLCQLDQVDDKYSEAKHWADNATNCSCDFFLPLTTRRDPKDSSKIHPITEKDYEPDQEKLVEIVSRGKIPLISLADLYCLNSDRMGDIEPDIIEYKSGMRYVAISHVWADGLGNNKRNSLPICQMVRLRGMIFPLLVGNDNEHIADRVCLWIDTLCVPLAPVEARKSAIFTMKEVYQEALAVLVLDYELVINDCPPTALETLVRVINCGWTRRLWTFQEAYYARNLFFEFKNECSSNISSLKRQVEDENSEMQWWGHLGIKWYPSIHSIQEIRIVDMMIKLNPTLAPQGWENIGDIDATLDEFRRIFWALSWRSTSKPEDETTCLALLLDIDVKPILEAPKKQRMEVLLRLRGRFPASIIFEQAPRLRRHGYNWAPRTFMSRHYGKGDPRPSKYGVFNGQGFCVRLPGILFPCNKVGISGRMIQYIIQLFNNEDELREVPSEGRTDKAFYSLRLQQVEDVPDKDWFCLRPDKLAIILPEGLSSADIDRPNFSCYVAVLAITSTGNCITYATQLCRGLLIHIVSQDAASGVDETAVIKAFGPLFKSVNMSSHLLFGYYTGQEMEWCIQ